MNLEFTMKSVAQVNVRAIVSYEGRQYVRSAVGNTAHDAVLAILRTFDGPAHILKSARISVIGA